MRLFVWAGKSGRQTDPNEATRGPADPQLLQLPAVVEGEPGPCYLRLAVQPLLLEQGAVWVRLSDGLQSRKKD